MRIINSIVESRHLHAELREFQASAAPAVPSPPSTNRGGTNLLPPTSKSNSKTKIDWLSFTSSVGIVLLRVMVDCLFPGVVFVDRGFGLPGYPSSYAMSLEGVPIGIIGFGAPHGKDYVSISGKGCGFWSCDFYAHVHDVLEACESKITRIDIAMDFFKGEVTYLQALEAYDAGEFKLSMTRGNPMQSLRGTTRDGLNMGRTMYVGSPKGAKLLRAYEKGLEVFARMPEDFQISCTDPGALVYGPAEGAPPSTIADQWLRVEVEFKCDQVLLDYGMIVNGDAYFAGAYPFCARIIGNGDGVRPEALKQSVDIDLAKMVMHAKKGYGNLVHSLRAIGYGDTAIASMLDTGIHNQRLVRSGVLSKLLSVDDVEIPF